MTESNYNDIKNVIEQHLEHEPEIINNIRLKFLTNSGKKMVIRNVYEIMREFDFDVNTAIGEYEQRLSNENY